MTLKSPGSDDWSLLLIDVDSKTMWFIDPRQPQDHSTVRLQGYATVMNRLLPRMVLNVAEPGRCERYPDQYFEALSNDVDSGICIFAIMFFVCAPCPLAFTAEDIVKLRSTFAYYLLAGDLPM